MEDQEKGQGEERVEEADVGSGDGLNDTEGASGESSLPGDSQEPEKDENGDESASEPQEG